MRKNQPANAASGKVLSPEAIRALEEAQARQKQSESANASKPPKEENGPKGVEPTRYGDWERGGIAYDF